MRILSIMAMVVAVVLIPIKLTHAQEDRDVGFLIRGDEAIKLDVTDARVIADQRHQAIWVKLSSQSARRLALFTQKNRGRVINVVVDGKVLFSPRINEPLLGGQMTILGGFNFDQAWTMAPRLKSGAAELVVHTTRH